MFGVRTTQVFTSRWKALMWSLGVLATAYCTIPAADESPGAAKASQVGSAEHDRQQREVKAALDALDEAAQR